MCCAVGTTAPMAASSPRRGPNNGAIMRPVGGGNKGGQPDPAQGSPVGQHLGNKGAPQPAQPPASPSAAAADPALGRAASGNGIAPGANGQYGLAYGMGQLPPQPGYSTPMVSKVRSNSRPSYHCSQGEASTRTYLGCSKHNSAGTVSGCLWVGVALMVQKRAVRCDPSAVLLWHALWVCAVQRPDQPSTAESPGLDDFAHMGLITDLLE